MTYELVERAGTAAELHALGLPAPMRAQLWWHRVTAPALVLGSTQRDDVVDLDACAAAGVAVVRRRSGGGAVLLRPGEVAWLDVILPAGAPGWAADVHAPMRWIGALLAGAVRTVLDGGAAVTFNEGAMRPTAWSSTVCFDGVGPGEVLVGGEKLIGISQRRSRSAARLQCSWYHRHDHRDLLGLLAAATRPPIAALQPVATLPADTAVRVRDLVLAALDDTAEDIAGTGAGGRQGGSGEEMGNNG